MDSVPIEQRLSEFRARKVQKKSLSTPSTAPFFRGLRNAFSNPIVVDESSMSNISLEDEENQLLSEPESVQAPLPDKWNQNLTWLGLSLKVLLWLVLWGLAIEFGFGAIYFILASLVVIYKNTRSSPKKKDELSAYSVFNPDCQRLDGTLTAEQFENEIRYGGMATRN